MTAPERLHIGETWISKEHTAIDASSTVHEGALIYDHVVLQHAVIGRWTLIGSRSTVWFGRVGAFCSISWDCTLGAVQHPMDRATTHEFAMEPLLGLYDGPSWLDQQPEVLVGNDVWMGCNAVVMPGVTINNGAVIGAGSVVTRDVEPYTVVAGVPARPIRRRLDELMAQRLDRLGWWDWPVEKLVAGMALFRKRLSDDVLNELEVLAP